MAYRRSGKGERCNTLNFLQMALGALLQIAAFMVLFAAGSIVLVMIAGAGYACGVLVAEYVREHRKGD